MDISVLIDLNQYIMKVIVAVILALGSVSALGSGPYLPSGWRPQGPSFYLPGEIQKSADNPLKETILFETEASGSDSLREYGPPKIEEVSNVINQGLPDVVTEQTFLVIEDKGAVSAVVVEESVASEETAEQNSEIVQEVTTEAQLKEIAEAVTEVFESRIADIALQQDITTATYAEAEAEVKAEEVQSTAASVEEKLEKVVLEEVKAVEEVQNVAEAIVTLEKEIVAEKVQSAEVETTAEIKVNQEGSGSAQVPEGFLEYGPPGFREYGPPKGDELQKSVVQDSEAASVETNEARRRRFSPKFRATKNKRLH